MFIRRNAERHRRAIDACGVAYDCTYFQPQDLRGGEVRLNLPKYAKRCLEEWIPQCEEALDELEMHPPPSTLPQSVRTNYMKYAHEAPSIKLRIFKMELAMLRDYGRPLKMKKDDEGYQDFWSFWVKKHYPAKWKARFGLDKEWMNTHSEGFHGLEQWLTANGACIEGARCYPNKLVSGGGQLNERFRGPL